MGGSSLSDADAPSLRTLCDLVRALRLALRFGEGRSTTSSCISASLSRSDVIISLPARLPFDSAVRRCGLWLRFPVSKSSRIRSSRLGPERWSFLNMAFASSAARWRRAIGDIAASDADFPIELMRVANIDDEPRSGRDDEGTGILNRVGLCCHT